MSKHPLQLRAAYGVCRHIARSAAKNFYYGFLVLPAPKRNALSAVYAFMRHADDISDDPSIPAQQRREKLDEWINALRRVVAGEPTDDPVLFALADSQKLYKIPIELLEKLVHGTAMDVPQQGTAPKPAPGAEAAQLQYDTFDQLYDYCYHVASVVGLICIRIFGYRDPRAEKLAEQTGVAFQLTNIIRDVKEDAEMGRVYLPKEDLARFGVEAQFADERHCIRVVAPGAGVRSRARARILSRGGRTAAAGGRREPARLVDAGRDLSAAAGEDRSPQLRCLFGAGPVEHRGEAGRAEQGFLEAPDMSAPANLASVDRRHCWRRTRRSCRRKRAGRGGISS